MMRPPTVSKTKRKAMLERQRFHCDCCEAYISTTTDARHDTTNNRMLCPACMLLISNIRKSLERNVTADTISEYLELPELELPFVEGKQTVQEKRAAARQAVAEGRVPGMTVEKYDAQFGEDE